MTADGSVSTPALAPNTSQRQFETKQGRYLVQVSWPINWGEDINNGEERTDVAILYVLDGNAYFFSATDIIRRLEVRFGHNMIVVAVGYPILHSVYDRCRRSADFTPPSRDEIKKPLGPDGKPVEGVKWGEADRFLEVLKSCIIPVVEQSIARDLAVTISSRALFGHSFGGLFSLYSLFSSMEMFDAYIIASPSIWFNDCSIVREQEADFLRKQSATRTQDITSASMLIRRRLFVAFGSLEQFPQKARKESKEHYQHRKELGTRRRMMDNILDMELRLRTSQLLDEIKVQELADEDHGSTAVCALQRGIQWLLDRK